jgi:hypothetical protein
MSPTFSARHLTAVAATFTLTIAGASGPASAAGRPAVTPVPGSVPPSTSNVQVIGNADGARPLSIQIWLKLRIAAAQRFASAVSTPGGPSFHHYLSPEGYAARFGPAPRQERQVAAWLRAQGFNAVHADAGRSYVRATAPTSAIDAAFRMQLKLHRPSAQVSASRYPLRANDKGCPSPPRWPAACSASPAWTTRLPSSPSRPRPPGPRRTAAPLLCAPPLCAPPPLPAAHLAPATTGSTSRPACYASSAPPPSRPTYAATPPGRCGRFTERARAAPARDKRSSKMINSRGCAVPVFLGCGSSLVTARGCVLACGAAVWAGEAGVAGSASAGYGRSRETVRRPGPSGRAGYGYCAGHSRWFRGLRLRLVRTLPGLPAAFALAGAKAGMCGLPPCAACRRVRPGAVPFSQVRPPSRPAVRSVAPQPATGLTYYSGYRTVIGRGSILVSECRRCLV